MLTLVFAAVAVAFGVAWWRRVAAYRRLSDAFDSAAAELEHLQRAFQRFVPHQVVEGIIQRGVHTSGERRVVRRRVWWDASMVRRRGWWDASMVRRRVLWDAMVQRRVSWDASRVQHRGL